MDGRVSKDPTITAQMNNVPGEAVTTAGFNFDTSNVDFSRLPEGPVSDVLAHQEFMAGQAMPGQTVEPLPQFRNLRRKVRLGIGAGVVAFAGVAAWVGLDAAPISGAQAKEHPGAVALPNTVDVNAILNTPVLTQSEAQLASGGYNCGHTLGAGESYANQIDYLNSNETLANNIIGFQINDPTFGMGESAWSVVKNEAIVNGATPASSVSEASPDSNTYAHFVTPVTLETPQDFLNFTCDTVPNTVTPVNLIKVTQEVNGIMFTTQGVKDFTAAANKFPNGQSKFVVIPVGMQNVITDATTGATAPQEVFVVVTEAGGCNNPLRAIPEKTPTPTTTNSSPTTTINHSPVTTFPPFTPTTFPRKVDTYQDPPGPNKYTPNTTVPEKTNPGTPDGGQPNPVGGTVPETTPTTEQPSPTTTATVPPETTVPPTTQPTQPGF